MADTSNRQSADMRRAKNAYDKVEAVAASKDDKYKGEYKSQAKKFGALVMTSGLGAAMSFLFSKRKKAAYNQLYSDISTWVVEQVKFEKQESKDLLRLLMANSSANYRLATIEAIAYATWLKRWVEGLLADVKDIDDSGIDEDQANAKLCTARRYQPQRCPRH